MVHIPQRPKHWSEADQQDHRMYDLSFMVSKHCDLSCSFCMYSSGPKVNDLLDFQKLRSFLKTVRYGYINAFGIYGGEPWLFMKENSEILNYLPSHIPAFVITNGTWSKNIIDTTEFMLWAQKHDLQVFVSGTDQHIPFQDREMLARIASTNDRVHLKPPDTQILPMGYLFGQKVKCTVKCERTDKPTRLAVQPDGSIIYQTCDGVYPKIGYINETFDMIDRRVTNYLKDGFGSVCPYYKEACQRKSLSSNSIP